MGFLQMAIPQEWLRGLHFKNSFTGAVVVIELAEQLPPTPEVCG